MEQVNESQTCVLKKALSEEYALVSVIWYIFLNSENYMQRKGPNYEHLGAFIQLYSTVGYNVI